MRFEKKGARGEVQLQKRGREEARERERDWEVERGRKDIIMA